jgi:hypothetical protein
LGPAITVLQIYSKEKIAKDAKMEAR